MNMDGVYVEITKDELQVQSLLHFVTHPNCGAVNLFVGTVRELTKGKRTLHLEYETYEEMALKQMCQIGKEIQSQCPQALVAISHRIGRLEISDLAVVIAVSTPHRDESFRLCRYAIERIKEMVPIWKKEFWESGEFWVGDQSEQISYQSEGPFSKEGRDDVRSRS